MRTNLGTNYHFKVTSIALIGHCRCFFCGKAATSTNSPSGKNYLTATTSPLAGVKISAWFARARIISEFQYGTKTVTIALGACAEHLGRLEKFADAALNSGNRIYLRMVQEAKQIEETPSG